MICRNNRYVRGLQTLILTSLAIFSLNGFTREDMNRNNQKEDVFMSPEINMQISGELGQRIENGINQWLIPAVEANPGMIEMMRLRDRNPAYENPLPWSGEFVGKHLTSAVLHLKLSNHPELRGKIAQWVADLISAQDSDGYLGPFRRHERLLRHWDLWNHYHIILGLHLWYQESGDQEALNAAIRIADLICNIYLNTGRRVYDAGSYECNMAIIHGLGILYRQTGHDRYFQLMRQIEKEWELPGAGDYYRQAMAGVDFYRIPLPRWESLHCLQGLYELYLITGEETYKDALLHYWHSIRRTDVHNAGSFSTHERAIGNPFMPGAIETCCTVSWMVLSVDALRLSHDSFIADNLELSLWNAVLAYQHPSGRWCTYDTPMDGIRIASVQGISFQCRPGTPELNCCSVNAPRGIGVLADWAVMESNDALYLNFYGPSRLEFQDQQGNDWVLVQNTQYPAQGRVEINLEIEHPVEKTLNVRIPHWSSSPRVFVNGQIMSNVSSGKYYPITRNWSSGDRIEIVLDMPIHHLQGDMNVDHRVSFYYGPILLAYDQKYNSFDPANIPQLDAQQLNYEREEAAGMFPPMVLFRFQAADGTPLRLCDYASAGAYGTHYQSWLPARNLKPGAFFLFAPMDGKKTAVNRIAFSWTSAGEDVNYTLTIAENADLSSPLVVRENLTGQSLILNQALEDGKTYYWQVQARNSHGVQISENGPWRFMADASITDDLYSTILKAPLDGNGQPEIGELNREQQTAAGENRFQEAGKALAFNGDTSHLSYKLNAFPAVAYTFCGWFKAQGMQQSDGKNYQIASAWKANMDDPLRIMIRQRRLIAGLENGIHYLTPALTIENDVWYHIAVVKNQGTLSLYVNGSLAHEIMVPAMMSTVADSLGIGCNPNYTGNETFRGLIDDITLFGWALTPEEVQEMYQVGELSPKPSSALSTY